MPPQLGQVVNRGIGSQRTNTEKLLHPSSLGEELSVFSAVRVRSLSSLVMGTVAEMEAGSQPTRETCSRGWEVVDLGLLQQVCGTRLVIQPIEHGYDSVGQHQASQQM